jgi:histone H3/H4
VRETTSPATKTIGATESADDVLGQFYFSFGQGAGTMRVERAAVAALRRRYFDNIKAAPAPWSAMSGSVLPLIAQVGRLAALLATQAGRTAITEADFMQARKTVESAVHPRANDTRRLVVGAVCAIIPEEDEQDDAGTEGGDAHDLFDMPVTSIRTN